MKLKILCFHGYRQNEKTFREKSGGFRKLLKKHVDFVFVAAPHEIPEEINLARPQEERERGWWFSKPNRSYHAMDRTDVCLGYEESLQLAKEKLLSDDGPFDGIMGFSQGAAFVSLLCALRGNPAHKLDFKFAIVVAGFRSMVSPHNRTYDDPIDCPSFHAIGTTDAVIPTQSSEDLLQAFVNGMAYRHDGGHYVPSSPHLRTVMLEFLAPFMQTRT